MHHRFLRPSHRLAEHQTFASQPNTSSSKLRRFGARSGVALALASLLGAGCSSEDKPSDTGGPATGSSGADWTMMGYDLASTYWNRGETTLTRDNVQSLTKAWEFDVKAGPHATPVISGGRVYLSCTPNNPEDPTVGGLVAIELATGNVAWRNPAAHGSASLALDDGVLYMHDFFGVVRAFDASDGSQKWEQKSDDNTTIVGFSSPVVAGDLVLVGGSSLEEVTLPAANPATFRGFVLALNKSDGSVAWKKYTVEPPSSGVGIWSTLSADLAAGVAFAATGNNYKGEPSDTSDAFLALSLADGSGDFLWKAQILENDVYTTAQSNGNPDADFGANPILYEIGGQKLAAGGNKGGDVWVVDRTNGAILQQRNLGPSNAAKGGVFINGAFDGSSILIAVNGATSQGAGSEAAPPNDGSVLFALDAVTLEIKWERQIGGSVYGPISVANGVGFVGKNKTLQAFDTETGEVLLEFPTEGTIATAPAISNGYVVFGSGMSWFPPSVRGTKYYALKVQ